MRCKDQGKELMSLCYGTVTELADVLSGLCVATLLRHQCDHKQARRLIGKLCNSALTACVATGSVTSALL